MKNFQVHILLNESQTKEYKDWAQNLVKAHFDEEVEFPGVSYLIESSPGFGTTLKISIGSSFKEFEIECEDDSTGFIQI